MTILEKNKPKQYTSALECLDTEKFKDFYMRQNETVRNPNFDYVLMEKIETLINSNVDMFSLPQDTPLCDILNSPISGDAVALALRKGKNNKAAGIDGIPVEFYRYGGDELQNTLLVLFNYLFEKGCYPEEWCEGIINPIHKIEDKINPEHYRKVTVTPAIGKLYETILNNRSVYAKAILGMEDPFQDGFKHGTRATDNAFLLNSLINITTAEIRPLYICYIDFKSAFDKVIRSALMNKLFVKGVRGKYFKVIKDMFDNSKSRVKYNSLLSDIFENLYGVLQGGIISPTLFNFFLDDLSEYRDKSKGIKVGTITVCHLLFADDLILASETPSGLQKLINGLEEFCKHWHMEVNLSKTSISILNKNNSRSTNKTMSLNFSKIWYQKQMNITFSA